MIISIKGVSVTAARRLIDEVYGENDLPLFVLHDFDVAGFLILGTLQRDTRRYSFQTTSKSSISGFGSRTSRGLEQRASRRDARSTEQILRKQLAENGATDEEIDIPVNERVELNAMPSGDLVAMIERKLKAYGLKKVVPDDDTLEGAYRAFHRSRGLRKAFEEIEKAYDAKAKNVAVPKDLQISVRAILDKHRDLRWDDAVRLVLDKRGIKRVRANKVKARKKAGDFTSAGEE